MSEPAVRRGASPLGPDPDGQSSGSSANASAAKSSDEYLAGREPPASGRGDSAQLSHLDGEGRIKMVDVTHKPVTFREAVARGEILLDSATIELIRDQRIPKGNVLEAARIAGIMVAKDTSRLIPLCHPLNPTGIDVEFTLGEDRIEVETRVRLPGRTGAEMEALAAAAVSLLTVYDMCKAVDKGMVISGIRLVKKTGGKSSADSVPD